MSHVLRSLLPAVLGSGSLLQVACAGGSAGGDWSGDCALAADGRDVDLTLSMSLSKDGETPSGGTAWTGTLTASEQDVEYLVQLSDDADGAVLSAAASVSSESGDSTSVFHLVVSGVLDGASFEGTGEYWTDVTIDGETDSSRRYTGACAFEKD